MFCTLECLGRCLIGSSPSMIVMSGWVVDYLELCLSDGFTSVGGVRVGGVTTMCFFAGMRIRAFGNPSLQGFLGEVLMRYFRGEALCLGWVGLAPRRLKAFY